MEAVSARVLKLRYPPEPEGLDAQPRDNGRKLSPFEQYIEDNPLLFVDSA